MRLDPATLWAAVAAVASFATVTLTIFLFREARATTRELHEVVMRLSEVNQREGDMVSGLSQVAGRLEQVARLLGRDTAERRLFDRLTKVERVHEGVMLLSARAEHADDHLGQGRYVEAKALLNAYLRSLPADDLPDTRAVAGMLTARMVTANIGNAFVETTQVLDATRRALEAFQARPDGADSG